MEAADSDIENCTPPEIIEAAQNTSLNLLPEKSRDRYKYAYNQFMEWRKISNVKSSFSENVLLAYITKLSETVAPPTLWTQYSMLKTTLQAHHDVDIGKYMKLRAFLKRKSHGYKPKKAKTLTTEEIHKFLTSAPDNDFLFEKVTVVLGISGACRKQELVQLTTDDVKDMETVAVFYVRNTKNKTNRSFHINGSFYEIYKKYANLRPITTQKRLFLNYKNGRCTQQVVGINKIGKVPQVVAKFLKLGDPEQYTGHSFRRSSATILVDAGGDLATLKRHGGWKSSTVAEGYIDDSNRKRTTIANKIIGAINSCSSLEPQISVDPQSTIIDPQSTTDPQSTILDEILLPEHPTVCVQPTQDETERLINPIIIPSQVANHDSFHHAPIQFANCSNNTFTFNFYNYSEKNE